MEIKFGAKVTDKNGKALGTVDYVVRNTWTGEISKFMVSYGKSEHFFFSPQDVLEATPAQVKVNSSLDELGET